MIFPAWVGSVHFLKKRTGTHYDELAFLHQVEYMGHVVHSGVTMARNIDAIFFMIARARCGFHKK
jgi:hypothetical protein